MSIVVAVVRVTFDYHCLLLLPIQLTQDRYIIDHYDNLPDAMLFIHSQRFQWHNDDPYYDGVGMLRNFQIPYLRKQGYVNLRCVWTLGCPSEIHPKSDTHRNDVHAGEYFTDGFKELFPGVPIPEEVGASCCAQFGVSRERVLERPRSDYVRFRDWLLKTDLTDDLSGRIMEYSWHSKTPISLKICDNILTCYSDFRRKGCILPDCKGMLL